MLFFIDVHTRRVFVASCTAHPTAAWVIQQARNLACDLDEAGVEPTLLVRDRDATLPRAFDDVFRSGGARVVRTPYQAPRASAHAERWVGTVRRECLDWLLILGRRHLQRVLQEYVDHYNASRPHRALDLHQPDPAGQMPTTVREIVRRDRVFGLIHGYERRAA